MHPDLVAQVLDLAIAIQQIPAPTFGEGRRAAFVYERFCQEGLSDACVDSLGNVYARLPGAGTQLPLVVSAHLDTVFPEGTLLQVDRQAGKIRAPGIGDNSLGVAGLFGLLWALRRRSNGIASSGSSGLPGDLWLVANVGEEGMGNLRGMRAVVERFAKQVKAYLILEGMALGQIYHQGLSVKRYRITANTPGGHAWVDYGQPSAIHELAALVTRLSAIQLPTRPRTSLNVGTISGGTTVNSIAALAECLLDLRSEDQEALVRLSQRVEALVASGDRTNVRLAWEVVGERPAGKLPVDHRLVRLATRCLERQGVKALPNIGSTDANIPLSLGIPAVCVGLTHGGNAHTPEEFIYVEPLAQGLTALVDLVEGIYQIEF